MRPVIGITAYQKQHPIKEYCVVSQNYIRSVCAAGGTPLVLPLVEEPSMLAEYLSLTDGLILTGGDDVCPSIYGENPIQEVEIFCRARDEFEIALFREALRMNLPVLGVCRGLHVMNTALGGTLYQDIFQQGDHVLGHFPKRMPVDCLYHNVQLTEGSRLARIFASQEIQVNSYHHQAAKDIADEFDVTARASDNIVEALEHREKDFIVAVQWHPEDLTVRYPAFLALFKALVNASLHSKSESGKKRKSDFL